jgi:hypothetical protein
MNIRCELVLGVVLLLGCILVVKVVWDLQTLPRLTVCLNLLWAMFAAFHAWPVFLEWTAGLALVWDGFPVEAAAFWFAFMVAALPGAVIYRLTVRGAPVDFPVFFDWLSGLVCTALGVWLVPCLVVMTVSITPASAHNVLPEDGVAGSLAEVMRATPLQLYLGLAETVGGEQRATLLAERIPKSLKDQVFPPAPRRTGKRP